MDQGITLTAGQKEFAGKAHLLARALIECDFAETADSIHSLMIRTPGMEMRATLIREALIEYKEVGYALADADTLRKAKDDGAQITVRIGTYGMPVRVHVVDVLDETVVLSFQDQSVHEYKTHLVKLS